MCCHSGHFLFFNFSCDGTRKSVLSPKGPPPEDCTSEQFSLHPQVKIQVCLSLFLKFVSLNLNHKISTVDNQSSGLFSHSVLTKKSIF